MSLGNFWCVTSDNDPQRFLVDAGAAASIKAGEPVVQDADNTEYVSTPPNSLGVSTGHTFVGIAVTTSTETASEDGYVYVAMPSANTRYRGYAHTASNLASSIRLTKTVIDYDSSSDKYTIDEDNTSNGFCQIVDYNTDNGTVDFVVDMTQYLDA